MANNTGEVSGVHVIFGSGPLGKCTARVLAGMGRRVRIINRSGVTTQLPASVEVCKADAYDAAANLALLKNARTVYQCAQPSYRTWAENFPRLQAAILDATCRSGARFVAAENIHMYGDTYGIAMREDTPYRARSRNGRVGQALTEALFAADKRGDVRAAALRGSTYFGPEDMIGAKHIFGPALAGETVNILGAADQPHTYTYTLDFGRALAIAGTNDAAPGRAWHVPSALPVPQQTLISMLEDALGLPVKTRVSSPWTMNLIGLFNPALRERAQAAHNFRQPFVVDSSAFTAQFCLHATPLHVQIDETLAWVRTLAKPKPFIINT
jgi:nucleoside-diphosphate-sugar epimerase